MSSCESTAVDADLVQLRGPLIKCREMVHHHGFIPNCYIKGQGTINCMAGFVSYYNLRHKVIKSSKTPPSMGCYSSIINPPVLC